MSDIRSANPDGGLYGDSKAGGCPVPYEAMRTCSLFQTMVGTEKMSIRPAPSSPARSGIGSPYSDVAQSSPHAPVNQRHDIFALTVCVFGRLIRSPRGTVQLGWR